MSLFASLVRAYERMAARGEVPAFGYSSQSIGYMIALATDGRPIGKPRDLRSGEGRKRVARSMAVPQPPKRTSDIAPAFLWDKTAYVLGVTAGKGTRTADAHARFVDDHRARLFGTDDPGLLAFLAFLDWWTAEKFAELGWPEEMKDQNVVFALNEDYLANTYLHDRPAAQQIWGRLFAEGERSEAACLVTGIHGPIARLHPAIKGVWGAQSSGASIVSFNLDAFTSYGHEQGDNAPVSDYAAFAYTTALNRFLERDSGHRLQVGDSSTVFWADAGEAEAALAERAEALGGFVLGAEAVDEAVEAGRIRAELDKIRAGGITDLAAAIRQLRAEWPAGVRFHILGLAPNAARLSVRFYVEDRFGAILDNYLRYLDDMRIVPPPREEAPTMWRLLIETAVLRKSDNIQPNLAGEWMRAILTGGPYPLTLLSSVVMRLRADGDVNALRVAILKSVLARNFAPHFAREVPVSLDPDFREPGYLLGRLFAVYEQIQTAALGRDVNATIKDKFYGAASAQPRKVFPLLDRGAQPHLSKLGKLRPGQRVNLEKLLLDLMGSMSPGDDPFPASLSERNQALFALGYYHQRNEFFRKSDQPAAVEASA